MQHAERRLAERFGDGELVHLLVVALLQVHDLALGRARDQDHRKAVGRSVGERSQAVEKARGRHREADARFLRQKASDRRRITGVLLVPERDDAQPGGLCHAAEVRDRDAGHTVDRLDAVELERIDDEVKSVRQLLLFSGCINALCGCGHFAPSQRILLGILSAMLLGARGPESHCGARPAAPAVRTAAAVSMANPPLNARVKFFPVNRARRSARRGRADAAYARARDARRGRYRVLPAPPRSPCDR